MKKVLYYPILLVTLLITLASISKTFASHAVGGDLTYQYLGPLQYQLTFRFYRDCSGIAAPTQVTICYNSDSTGLSGQVTLNPIAGTGQPIAPSLCVPCTGGTQCTGGSCYGVEEYIFQGTVTLPAVAPDWIFSFEECCRNPAISNLQNPGGIGYYVSTTLDNSNFLINNSPTFAQIPVTQFCINNQFYYDQQATDIDGDSLVYALVAAEDGTCGGAPFNLTYNPGYSPLQPVTTATGSGVSIDPNTGIVSFVPTNQEVDVICVRVTEYRNGVQLGSVKRDIQINIEANCIVYPPSYDSTLYNSSIGTFVLNTGCGQNSVIISFNNPIQCGSVVPTDFRAVDVNGLPNPAISATPINCANGLTDSILVTFLYPFTAGTSYAFTKIGNDGNTFLSECGTLMPEFDSIAIAVVDTGIYSAITDSVGCYFSDITLTFSEEFTCGTINADGSDFQLVDASGTNVPIASVSSTCSPTTQYDYNDTYTLHFAGISGGTLTSPLYVIAQNGADLNTIANKCGTYFNSGDTLAILTIVNNIFVDLGPDVTACDANPLPVLDAGNTGVQYTWFLNSGQLSDTTQTLLADSTGTYIVNLFYSASCTGSDTIDVVINHAPVVALGNDTAICRGDAPPTFNAGNSGASYQWYFNGLPLPADTLQTLTADTSLGNGMYSVIVSTDTICAGNDAILFSIQQPLSPDVGINQAVCQNTSVSLSSGVSAAGYQWTLNGSPISGETNSAYNFTASQAGTFYYGVIVSTSAGCIAADSMQLTVNAGPTNVNIGQDTTVCINNNYALSTSTGAGYTFQWYNSSGMISGATNNSYTPAVTDNYYVVVTSAGCTATDSAYVSINTSIPAVASDDTTICSGGSASISGSSTVPNVTYLWSTGATTQNINATTAGTYTVTLTDASGCSGTDSAKVLVNTSPDLAITATDSIHDAHIHVCKDDPFPKLTANSGTAGVTYSWTFTPEGSTTPQTAGNSPDVQTGTTVPPYGTFEVTVKNSIGCESKSSIDIEEEACDIEPYNIMTPNGDDKNDFFFIENIETNTDNTVQIFNRWGNKIYDESGYNNGSVKFTGEDLPDGTYFYIITVPELSKIYQGTLNIISEPKK